MREEEEQGTKPVQVTLRDSSHPWVDMPVDDDSLDETLRYSLDEIRFA
jgi:hypothetical protein